MATLLARPHNVPSRSTTPIMALPPHLSLNTSFQGAPTAVPNKHIPYSSPGPIPSYAAQLPSPPISPPTDASSCASLLHPPDRYARLSQTPAIYGLTAAELAAALDYAASQPLPDPKLVFPWLHGLHPDNQMQLTFFNARRKRLAASPECLRTTTIVKAGGDLGVAKIRGAVSPDEFLERDDVSGDSHIKEVDPRHGFSVRNFQIQTCKMATVSDIIVYGDDTTSRDNVQQLALLVAKAQRQYHEARKTTEKFNTFVLTDSFSKLAEEYPDLVSVDAEECITGKVIDFSYQERLEMCCFSKAAEICPAVWLGPTPDPALYGTEAVAADDPTFNLLIETTDFARMPDRVSLDNATAYLQHSHAGLPPQANLEFPSSGSLATHTCTDSDLEDFISFCSWLHDTVSDSQAKGNPIRVLIHCADGYTETSMLALGYFMYSQGVPAHEAWIRLHTEKKRDFFAYQSDKILLEYMQQQILDASPALQGKSRKAPRCAFAEKMDGSLPSRILPHLYLGNLHHAQNPEMLRALGISRLLSVGEPIIWTRDEIAAWGKENLLYVDKVQDNGVDPLTSEFERCLEFIDEAKAENHATLVHCRVGVSRSATICIAQVMKDMNLSLPRAYCFVRARRLNVIIQPHLRFMYELLKWEELQGTSKQCKRDIEWATICREIALINKPYCRG